MKKDYSIHPASPSFEKSGIWMGRPSWHWLWIVPVLTLLLSPCIYGMLVGLARMVEGPAWLETTTFSRVFQRVLMISAALVVFPLLWMRGYRKPSQLGFCGSATPMTTGVGLGILCVGMLLVFQITLGARRWDEMPGVALLLNLILVAGLVSLLEEALFRGVLFQELRERMSLAWAVGIQAAVYAAVHFLKNPFYDVSKPVGWDAGLQYALSLGEPFLRSPAPWMEAVILFLLGLLLAGGRIRYGNLWWSVGFHAGLVFAIQLAGRCTDPRKGIWRPWIHRDLDSGLDAVVLLALFALFFGWIWRKPRE